MTTIAEHIIRTLADHGVEQSWGVVGDALNPLTDAIRRDGRIQWIGVRHEEVAAFAAGAQAQLSNRIGLCMGTVGPGSVHLLNGLYDAKKSHAPVLAICGQVPSAEAGSDYFQEVNNDLLFADVAVYNQTITSAEQVPHMLEQAINTAYAESGVAVLTLPGDLGTLELDDPVEPALAGPLPAGAPAAAQLDAAAAALNDVTAVTVLAGIGARESRAEVLALCETLNAPMVVTIKGKDAFDDDNPFNVGQSGLIGNPAAAEAFDGCDVLLMLGTDFPYREWFPEGKTVIQVDVRPAHIGRRTQVNLPLVGDVGETLRALQPRLQPKKDDKLLTKVQKRYADWRKHQGILSDSEGNTGSILERIRGLFDNPDDRIRPEMVGALLDELAPADAVFTTDTGMSTVWMSRFISMRDERRLLGSFNLGSMANALPQALGAQALDRSRPVVAMCGDGGLMMLLGDMRTAVTYDLPVVAVVFNNSRLGMVKLEQEQGGLPEFGTELDNPDFAAVATAMGWTARRVEEPEELEESLRWAFAQRSPVLIDVLTNPDEISVPPKPTVEQGWGFAIAKVKETLESRR